MESIISLVLSVRNEHGVRHSDYQRYRRICSKRLLRLRKPNLTKTLSNLSLTTTYANILIPLFQTERNWAYALELKLLSKLDPRKLRHLKKKLKRAKVSSEAIVSLVDGDDSVPAFLKDEIKAYADLMAANYFFEKLDWKESLAYYTNSKKLLQKLASNAQTSEFENLYSLMIDLNEPNVRYCLYNLKGHHESGLNKLADEKKRSPLNKDWRNMTLEIKNAKLFDLIGQFEDLELNLQNDIKDHSDQFDMERFEARLELYENLLGILWDATRITEADLKEDEIATQKVTSSISEENTATLKAIHGFVAYTRLTKTIERTFLLIKVDQEKIKLGLNDKRGPKPENVIKLFDTLSSSLGEIDQLPFFESDIAIKTINSIKLNWYKALRCIYISELYSGLKKTVECLKLLEIASDYIKNGKSTLGLLSKKGKSKLIQDDNNLLLSLSKELNLLDEKLLGISAGEKFKFFQNNPSLSKGAVNENLTLASNLEFRNEFNQVHPNLIEFPLQFLPIPSKPFFFDTAFNFIVDEEAEAKEREKASLTGGLKGWFGL